MKIGIIGAGSWGCALAILFAKEFSVQIYSRSKSQVFEINQHRTNIKALPLDIKFPNNVIASNELSDLSTSDLLVIATPVGALRDVLHQIKKNINGMPDIIWVCKGFEPETCKLPHEVVNEVLNSDNVGALLGPSFALEVAKNLPTAITLASANSGFVNKWMNNFSKLKNFRVYANDDLIGCELASGIKNVIAIAVGISDGKALGLNARAALITRSLSELQVLVLAYKGKPETIYGLTGIGDLILTCTGDLSRNRAVGQALARGENLEEILQKMGHVVEGVYAAKVLYQLALKLQLDMPIVNMVYQILYEDASIDVMVNALFMRKPKHEFN